MLCNPPLHLLHGLLTGVGVMHLQHELDHAILLLQVALAPEHCGV